VSVLMPDPTSTASNVVTRARLPRSRFIDMSPVPV
jgi:hypothetical protein